LRNVSKNKKFEFSHNLKWYIIRISFERVLRNIQKNLLLINLIFLLQIWRTKQQQRQGTFYKFFVSEFKRRTLYVPHRTPRSSNFKYDKRDLKLSLIVDKLCQYSCHKEWNTSLWRRSGIWGKALKLVTCNQVLLLWCFPARVSVLATNWIISQ
jgi:hypothetical protein